MAGAEGWRKKVRVIPRLDVRGSNVIKGFQLEGVRIVGEPEELARRYYEQGADEVLYLDAVASLYGRDNLIEIVARASRSIFVPLTAGGGVRTLQNVEDLLKAGADKVTMNSAAIRRPDLIREAAHRFGAQCVVLSIEAKRRGDGRWEAYCDSGREKTGLDVVEWSRRAVELGAGEVLLTSVDRDGTRKGFDVELVRRVSEGLPVPVIASSGGGTAEHAAEAVAAGADAVAFGSALHARVLTVDGVKAGLAARGVAVRR